MDEPGALNVVAITLKGSPTPRPVVLEEEVEMVGSRVEDMVGKDMNEIADGSLDPRQHSDRRNIIFTISIIVTIVTIVTIVIIAPFLQAAKEVGVGLDDVEMGVLRLRVVGVEFGETHVGYLAPLTRRRLDVAVVDSVERMLLNAVEEAEGCLGRAPHP